MFSACGYFFLLRALTHPPSQSLFMSLSWLDNLFTVILSLYIIMSLLLYNSACVGQFMWQRTQDVEGMNLSIWITQQNVAESCFLYFREDTLWHMTAGLHNKISDERVILNVISATCALWPAVMSVIKNPYKVTYIRVNAQNPKTSYLIFPSKA